MDPKKILIVRFSSIGDIVLTSPVIRCLKKKFPAAEIHFLTKKSFATVLKANPYLSKLHLLDESFPDLVKELKLEKFDLLVDLHHNLRTRRLKMSLRLKSVSFYKANWEKWLMTFFKLNRLPKEHIVDRYLDCVRALGVQYDGLGLDYFIPPAEEVDVNERFHLVPLSYTAIVIGAKHKTKQLPAAKLIELLHQLEKPAVLLGGKEDIPLAEEIMKFNLPHLVNATGQLSLNNSASVLKQAADVISHDTGLMHMAAAFQKPIVSIWGNTISDFGMYPYLLDARNSFQSEVKNLPCRPCSKIGYSACPKGHFDCMLKQDTTAIADWINHNERNKLFRSS